MARLDHVCIETSDYEEYCAFFIAVFSMNVEKTKGNIPSRIMWFKEGIQINEVEKSKEKKDGSGAVGHLCIKVEDVEEIYHKSMKRGCTGVEGKTNWVILPNGVKIELKPLD